MGIDFATLRDVFAEQESREEELRLRNPSFSFWYSWLIACLVVALFVSFVIWGGDIKRNSRDEAVRSQVLAEMEAEREKQAAEAEAAELKAQQEDAALQVREAQAIARMWFGIRNFTSTYHYTNSDLFTYAYCPYNRAAESGDTVEEELAKKGQFIAYSDKNDLQTDLYNLALSFVSDMHAGRLPECDSRFRYAVLRDTGIWLVDDPNKAVPERWHA